MLRCFNPGPDLGEPLPELGRKVGAAKAGKLNPNSGKVERSTAESLLKYFDVK